MSIQNFGGIPNRGEIYLFIPKQQNAHVLLDPGDLLCGQFDLKIFERAANRVFRRRGLGLRRHDPLNSNLCVSCWDSVSQQEPWACHAGDDIHSSMPSHYRNQAVACEPDSAKQQSQNHCAQESAATLIQMSKPEQRRGNRNRRPARKSRAPKRRHGKAAIEELFAKSGSDCQDEEQSEFARRLGKNALSERQQAAAGGTVGAADAAEVGPLECCEEQSTYNGK